MSENDMNEQPTGQQPAEGAEHPTSAPAAGEVGGWRPPSEQAATPVPPMPAGEVPTTQMPAAYPAPSPYAAPAPQSEPTASEPVAQPEPASPYAPPAAYTPPGYTPPGYTPPGYTPPGYAQAGYAEPGYAPGSAYPTGAQETPTASYPTAGTASSSYPATGTHDARPRRGSKALAGLAIAGLLVAAIGGGAAGAAIMHHWDGTSNTVTVTSDGKVVSNAPIIDRSSLASIASAVSPSVVSITTQNAEGSGVILSKDGYILTNNHVAATASGQTVDITFSDGSSAKATLVGTDPKTDLAVFKAENVSNLKPATFGDSKALQVGDTVLAIGSPLGLDGTVTAGIVSALNRTIDESSDDSSPQDPNDPFGLGPSQAPSTSTAPTIAGAIQTDASINPGNSGGALVNTNGEVVGINTAIATNGGADGSIGVGFAIPSDRAQEVANDIIKGVPVSHPQLGIEVATADDNAGALVSSVVPGSAADKGGLKANDVITAFDGQAVHTSDDLLDDIQSATVGTSYTLTVDRGGQTVTATVVLQEAK